MYLNVYIDPPHQFDLWYNRKETRAGADGKQYPVEIRRLGHVQNALYHELWVQPTKSPGKRRYDRRPPPQRRTMCRRVRFTVRWSVNGTPTWDKANFDSTNTPRVIIATIHEVLHYPSGTSTSSSGKAIIHGKAGAYAKLLYSTRGKTGNEGVALLLKNLTTPEKKAEADARKDAANKRYRSKLTK